MRKTAVILILLALIMPGCAYHYDIVRMPESPLYSNAIIINNTQYLPVLNFCDYYNLDWDWDLVSQRIEIKRNGQKIVLRPNSKLALLNGKAYEFNDKVEYKNGMAYIPAESAIYISKRVLGLREEPISGKITHRINSVVLDPGHGGKDPGAVSRYGTKEKDVVLDVSKRIKRKLEQNGIKVYMTRENDTFIPLKERPRVATKKKADLFISVHANASRASRVKGFEVYYLSEATDDNARAIAAAENASLQFENNITAAENGEVSKDPTLWDLKLTEQRRQSKGLAYYICNISSDALSMKKLGVKGARFAVLKGAEVPAVLVEIGFLTNKSEESKLKSSAFREKIADAVAKSIISYKKEYEKTNGFSQ